MSTVTTWYIIQNYVLNENWFNHPFVLIPNHTAISKSCCLVLWEPLFPVCEYTSLCKWNQGLLRRMYYCTEKMGWSSENLVHPSCTYLKKGDSLLKHNELDHCHSYGSPSLSDPGPFVPNIPVSPQASTWGRCPPHLFVYLVMPPHTPSHLLPIGPCFFWAKPSPV